jgi:pimeloyl-ACP methyl ester carboxylesterase
MTSMPETQALPLHEAAKRMGVQYKQANSPVNKTISANGLKFHYLEWGDPKKQKVLMLHGVAQQAHSWDFISLALSDRYNVLALDQRGHGDTEWPPDHDYSADAQQRDLDAVIPALGLKGFILIGHSMGGRNAYLFTFRHPDLVKALAIVDTGPGGVRAGSQRIRRFVTLPDELDSYEEFAKRVEGYTGRPSWMVHGSLQHSIKRLPSGKWTWKYDKAIRSPDFKPKNWPPEKLWEALEKIKCPTLVVRGANTDVLSEEAFQKMLQVIPKVEGATVAKAGHLVAGDNPSGFLEALEPFMRGAV